MQKNQKLKQSFMKINDYIIRFLKKSYRLIFFKKFHNPECDLDRQSANDKIFELLENDKPCMIARFGTTELNCINNYLCVHSEKKYIKRIKEYITDNTHTPWWNTSHFNIMSIYSGIFPPSIETSEKFAKRYLQDIPLIDLLGSFQYHEKFMPLNSDIQRVHLETLYPFFVESPWTRALKGKKILVVHPFDESIRAQYEKRALLFNNPNILPDYTLITLKAVQSVAGTKVPFKDWFEALEYMEDQISKIDFDICILGCGAYGLPLAAYIKRMGKKSIHIGGGTQLLFGIKGSRWLNENTYDNFQEYNPGQLIYVNYKSLFNESWVFPKGEETPKNSINVENACYW